MPFQAALGLALPIAIGIAAIGSGTVVLTPLALRSGLLYPLSRSSRAFVAHGGGLVQAARFAIPAAAFFA